MAGQKYITLSARNRIKKELIQKCERELRSGDLVLEAIAKMMKEEFHEYTLRACTALLSLVRVLDISFISFKNYFLKDDDIFRMMVVKQDVELANNKAPSESRDPLNGGHWNFLVEEGDVDDRTTAGNERYWKIFGRRIVGMD